MSRDARVAPDAETAAFADRVMAVVEATPDPTPSRSFLGALRGRSPGDALSSLAVAWHLATVRSWSIAPRVRARSMALVLAVTSVLATGSLVAAAAAVNVAAPPAMDDHHVAAPTVSPDWIADPGLEVPGSEGRDDATSLDADHHMNEPVVETEPEKGPETGHHEGDGTAGAKDDASDGTSDDSEDAGSSSHQGDDDGHARGSTTGSHDGETSDSGSRETHDGDSGHDDGGSTDSGGSHDGGDGGD